MLITKKEIAKMTQDLCDYKLNKACAIDVVDSVLSAIMNHIAHGDRVRLHNFGTFYRRTRRAYLGHCPKTGKKVVVQNKELICFKPSKNFQQYIAS